MVAVDHELIGAIELLPTVRPEARATIQALRAYGIQEIYIISGDREGPTKVLAQQLGIDGYFAETLPQQKATLIEQLQRSGKHVCFVGDGINDSIALKTANVSVSLRGASTIAIDTAQIVLMDENLAHLPRLFDVGQQFANNLHTNFNVLLAATVIGATGVLFLHFGIMATTIVSEIALLTALTNAVRPVLQQKAGELRNSPATEPTTPVVPATMPISSIVSAAA